MLVPVLALIEVPQRFPLDESTFFYLFIILSINAFMIMGMTWNQNYHLRIRISIQNH